MQYLFFHFAVVLAVQVDPYEEREREKRPLLPVFSPTIVSSI